MSEDKETKARKVRVSKEDMDRIERTLEVCRRLQRPEHEIQELRNNLIAVYGEEIKQ